MLVISRRVGEVIRIGEDISVRICNQDGSAVRVGIDAPRTIEVHRAEVYERLLAERGSQASRSIAHVSEPPAGDPHPGETEAASSGED